MSNKFVTKLICGILASLMISIKLYHHDKSCQTLYKSVHVPCIFKLCHWLVYICSSESMILKYFTKILIDTLWHVCFQILNTSRSISIISKCKCMMYFQWCIYGLVDDTKTPAFFSVYHYSVQVTFNNSLSLSTKSTL